MFVVKCGGVALPSEKLALGRTLAHEACNPLQLQEYKNAGLAVYLECLLAVLAF